MMTPVFVLYVFPDMPQQFTVVDTKFESDEVKNVVSDWPRHQSKEFYTERIRKLVHLWERV